MMFYLFRSKILLCVSSFILGCTLTLITINIEKNADIPKEQQSLSQKHILPNITLVVLIFSSVDSRSKRDAIRETWTADFGSSQEVKYFFVISGGVLTETQKLLLNEERKRTNDLLIFQELEDSFYLLTAKLVSSMQWISSEFEYVYKTIPESKPFNRFSYMLKCDDDTFVRINRILQELKLKAEEKDTGNLYWGFFDGRARVNHRGKYKENKWYICDNYIPYALGGGYVLGEKLVNYLAKNSPYLKLFSSEDVSVGAWLSTFANIDRVHDPRFDTEYISRGCNNQYLVTHKHSENAMRKFQNSLDDTGNLCVKQFQTRLSYIYNWNVPPSKCCARNNSSIP